MDPELLKILVSTGVGGVLAGIVLWWKRLDDQKHAADLKTIMERRDRTDDRTLQIIDANTAALRSLQGAVENVASLRGIEERLRQLEFRRGS